MTGWPGRDYPAYQALQAETEGGQRRQWAADAAAIREAAAAVEPAVWFDNRRQQAAVRYWLTRMDQPRSLKARVCGRPGRFRDPITAFADLFDKVLWRGADRFTAKCPAHPDRTPSLSVARGSDDNRMLVHCFAGCDVTDVLAAVGWRLSDLFAST